MMQRPRAKMAPIACVAFCLLGSFLSTTCAEGLESAVHTMPSCPEDGFAYYNGSQWFCFRLFTDFKNFNDAEAQCKQLGTDGHLASLTSKTESNIIASYVAQRNVDEKNVWIGLDRDKKSNQYSGWRWTDGTPFLYANWWIGEPDNHGKGEFCAALPRAGYHEWRDYPCSHKFPYLCKWKPS